MSDKLITLRCEPDIYIEYRRRLLTLGRTVKDDITAHMIDVSTAANILPDPELAEVEK